MFMRQPLEGGADCGPNAMHGIGAIYQAMGRLSGQGQRH
jgi:hypothetical protein